MMMVRGPTPLKSPAAPSSATIRFKVGSQPCRRPCPSYGISICLHLYLYLGSHPCRRPRHTHSRALSLARSRARALSAGARPYHRAHPYVHICIDTKIEATNMEACWQQLHA